MRFAHFGAPLRYGFGVRLIPSRASLRLPASVRPPSAVALRIASPCGTQENQIIRHEAQREARGRTIGATCESDGSGRAACRDTRPCVSRRRRQRRGWSGQRDGRHRGAHHGAPAWRAARPNFNRSNENEYRVLSYNLNSHGSKSY